MCRRVRQWHIVPPRPPHNDLIGGIFALHLVTPQFLFSLGTAKEIACQLGRVKLVEDVQPFLQTLASMNSLGGQAVVETAIAVILKDGKVDCRDNTRRFRG